MNNIVDELVRIQTERKIRPRDFAYKLKIRPESWSRIKRLRIIGAETLLQAVRVFPELIGYLCSPATYNEKPPEPRRGGLWGRVVIILKRPFKGG